MKTINQPIAGQPAPDFSLTNLDGLHVRLSNLRGQIVLICFWSAECPWVERTDELLRPLLDQWGARVVYLPINPNANESPQQMRISAEARGMRLPLWDKDSAVAELYGVEINPQFFVVDAAGLLRYSGAFDDISFRQRTPTRTYVPDAVLALLDGNDPEIDHTAPYGCTVVRYRDLIV